MSSIINFSLEVFPAKTDEAEIKLIDLIHSFAELKPKFISITCGANSSENKQFTPKLTEKILKSNNLNATPHITAVGYTKAQMKRLLDFYQLIGVNQVLLLRGDLPKNKKSLTTDFPYAYDLIKYVKKNYDFKIIAAAYPETHPEAISVQKDIENLRAKVDAGADKLITQFFMDPEIFLRFRDKVQSFGIEKNLIPGILPIANFAKIQNFAKSCGSEMPKFMHKMFADVEPKSLDHHLLAMNVLSHQITRLIEAGVQDFHLYTLNQSLITRHLCVWMKAAF